MRTISLNLLIVACHFLSSPELADAQPLVAGAESIETTVINADLVFVAKVIKIRDSKQVDGREVFNTSIEIEKTLKQEVSNHEPYTKLQMSMPRSLAVLKDWQDRSARLLVAYDENQPDFTTVIELVPGKMEILKSDFTLLREPKDVIRAAEDALQRTPAAIKRMHTFRLWVPRKLIADTKWEQYHGLRLTVPVDKQLEQRAIRNLVSDNYQQREEAVRALRYFKTEENIERVKSKLGDAGWSYLRHPLNNNGVGVRLFGVRKEAYHTLKLWDVEVEEPVFQEEFQESIE